MPHPDTPASAGAAEPQEAHPAFIRRCAHRSSAARAPSEKLGRIVAWTTRAQGFLVNLMEVTHSVVDFQPWAFPVTLRVGWGEPFEYWPALGFTGESGRRVAVDVFYEKDRDDRESVRFERLLDEALTAQGFYLTAMSEEALASAPKTAVARMMVRFAGVATTSACVARLREVLATHGGSTTLGQLRRSAADGGELVAAACVLGMRRRLRLDVSKDGLDASSVSLLPKGGDV